MTQVFLHGAYKYPRELTWLTGVCLLLCVLGMFFSGQILRWDPECLLGLGRGRIDGRPSTGDWAAGRPPLLGAPTTIGGAALSPAFFGACIVFVIPGRASLALVGIHLLAGS